MQQLLQEPVPPGWARRLLWRLWSGEAAPAAPATQNHRSPPPFSAQSATGDNVAADATAPANERPALTALAHGTGSVTSDACTFDDGSNPAISGAVADALAEMDRKAGIEPADASKRRRGVFGRAWGGLASIASAGDVRQPLLRLGAGLVAANLTAWGIDAWGRQEALRFPGLLEKSGQYVFPLYGECQAGEYWFLLIDLMLVAGVAAYFGVRWVEAHLE